MTRQPQEVKEQEEEEVEVEEEEVYRTWPDRKKLSPARAWSVEVTGSVSVQHLTTSSTSTQPMSMAAALESLNISYCPDRRSLQPSLVSAEVESDENDCGNIYYKPGHRKAYSLHLQGWWRRVWR